MEFESAGGVVVVGAEGVEGGVFGVVVPAEADGRSGGGGIVGQDSLIFAEFNRGEFNLVVASVVVSVVVAVAIRQRFLLRFNLETALGDLVETAAIVEASFK